MRRLQPILATVPASAANGTVDEIPAHDVSFLQRPFVQNLLPFVTSLSVHAGVLTLGLLTYTAITLVHQPTETQINPVDATVFQPTGLPGVPENAPNPNLLRPAQDKDPEHASDGPSDFSGKMTDLNPAGGGAANEGADVIAEGMKSGFGHGAATGLKSGATTGDEYGDGLLKRFGTPVSGLGPKGIFWQGPSVHKIAYVCDASGSMINKMPSLKMELEKAIAALRISQNFSLIFFQASSKPDMLEQELVRATPENKLKAGRFLEGIVATSTTDPLPGLDAAFRQKPEMIFLLTDGDFPDNQAVLARIRELNSAKKVRINTIAFVGSSDNDTEFLELLKTIATENGGTFKHVSEESLGQ